MILKALRWQKHPQDLVNPGESFDVLSMVGICGLDEIRFNDSLANIVVDVVDRKC